MSIRSLTFATFIETIVNDYKECECIDLTLDFIEQPFWFSFTSDDKTKTLKAYAQLPIYCKDESMVSERGHLVFNRASGIASGGAVKKIKENMEAFYLVCQKLSCLIQEKGLEQLYADLNPDEAGILLMENNGELSWKVVSGRERPDLMIQTLFDDDFMGRPYKDELDEDDGISDATETMRKNLKAAGKDASDEAIANMSYEEACAAFYGVFDDEDE